MCYRAKGSNAEGMSSPQSDYSLNKDPTSEEERMYLRGGRTTEFSVRKVEGAEDWS